MNDWVTTLDGLLQQVWAQLAEAAETSALVSLATVSPTHQPEARTVVLRAADSTSAALEIYTDLQSDKIASLRATPRAAILHWDQDRKLQIRATCRVTILSGSDVMDRWRGVPDHSRVSYGMTPPPGRPIPTSTAYVKKPDPAVFAVLSCEVTHLDAVHLGQPHRRAFFARDAGSQPGDWRMGWLAP